MPFLMGKIDRVSFGLLTAAQLAKAAHLTKSRELCAVPFVGKDVPSPASEFSHPDVVIGLTVLAYRYEGLRPGDFKRAIRALQGKLQDESGPYKKRPSYTTFAKWVALAGGRVRGIDWKTQNRLVKGYTKPDTLLVEESVIGMSENDYLLRNVWPLQLVDTNDPEQFQFLHHLMHKLPAMVYNYLHEEIFPETMTFRPTRLCANGQEIGGDLLFGMRFGFSGTPSSLVPEELKPCAFERGDDAAMLHTLTSPGIVEYQLLETTWHVTDVLNRIAASSFHALIDTGALVTGFTNFQVAEYLVTNGLPKMKGCVFLDENDNKMILLRSGMKVVKESQSSVPWGERFTFYVSDGHVPAQLNARFSILAKTGGHDCRTRRTRQELTSSRL